VRLERRRSDCLTVRLSLNHALMVPTGCPPLSGAHSAEPYSLLPETP